MDCGGIDLSWGNAGAMRALIKQIAYKEKLGTILSQGVRRAAVSIGHGAERYAPHVKGLELAAYHPRSLMGTALGYTVAGRGGDYSSVYASIEYNWSRDKAAAEFGNPEAVDRKSAGGKAPLIRRALIINAVLDALGICKVPALSMIGAFDLKDEAELAAAVSGVDLSAAQLFSIGERIVTKERLLNLRYGVTVGDDCLPQMFFDPEYMAGHAEGDVSAKLSEMQIQFYQEMGWDSQGQPTPATCKSLGIDSSFMD